MRLKAVFLVLAGLVVGVFAAQGISLARAADGGWQCYVVDRLENPKDAGEWKGAVEVAQGLNSVAASVAAGTLLSVQYPVTSGFGGGLQSDVGLICVKK